MTFVVATTPYFDEDPAALNRAGNSIPSGFEWLAYEAPLESFATERPLATTYPTESAMRNFGCQYAASIGGEWWLQLDADEELVHGDDLADILDRWPHRGYPLPRLEEDGAVAVCPYKLVRLPCELVAGCDHFRWPGDSDIYRMSLDHSAAEHERAALLETPHLKHSPSSRWSGRATPRIGTTENVLEPRPVDAIEWAPPTLPQLWRAAR